MRVLRTAMSLLIGDNAPPPRVYAGSIPTRQPDRWAALRPQLRELAYRERAGRIKVGQAIGVAPTTLTLTRLLGANSAGPGIAVAERAEAWLASRDAPAPTVNGVNAASAAAPSQISVAAIAPSSRNGVETQAGEGAQTRPLGVGTPGFVRQKNCSQSEPTPPPQTAPPRAKEPPSPPGNGGAGNGHDRAEPLPAYRLSLPQRERLAAYVQFDPISPRLTRMTGASRWSWRTIPSTMVISKGRSPKANTAAARFTYGTGAIGSPRAPRHLSKPSQTAISSWSWLGSVCRAAGFWCA